MTECNFDNVQNEVNSFQGCQDQKKEKAEFKTCSLKKGSLKNLLTF